MARIRRQELLGIGALISVDHRIGLDRRMNKTNKQSQVDTYVEWYDMVSDGTSVMSNA